VQNPRDFSFSKRIPQDDTRERLVCDTCGWINYTNPKIVVGSVVSHEGRILLCRRAIEPRRGFWTIPAGYLEEKETTEAGAMREAQEEACAEIAIDQLLAVYNIPRISQVQLIYRATLVREPGRARSLFGAGRAAQLAGDRPGAAKWYREYLAAMEPGDGRRQELATARAALER
jgi:ADP-ribose pyrophosphatase YjhB (NUDIX family)